MKTIGEKGSGPGQFTQPRRVCFGPGDCFIVADWLNDRLQEFTPTGEHKRDIAVTAPFAVTTNRDGSFIAVGSKVLRGIRSATGTISLLEYVSGAVIRSIGEDVIRGSVNSIAFMPDDTGIVITSGSDAVTLFSVAGVAPVASICRGITAGGFPHDVAFAENGEMFVSDNRQSRVLVYTPGGSVQLRSFGSELKSSRDHLLQPTALSLVNGRLYVLDCRSHRVKVFE